MLFWAIVIIKGENHVAVKKDATLSTPPLKKKQAKRPKFKMCGFSPLFPSFPNPLSKNNLLSFPLAPHFSLFCFTLSGFSLMNFHFFFTPPPPPPLPLNFGE